MTKTKIIAGTAAVWSIVLVAAGAAFRDARVDAEIFGSKTIPASR
jgi:hypothetical protein